MIGLGLVFFWLVDGMVRGNTAPSAAPVRAGLVAILAIVLGLGLWRSKIGLPVIGAGLAGILAAMAVSEAYYRATGGGIGTWLMYAGVWYVSWVARVEVRPQLALSGMVVTGLVLCASLVGPPPGGMFNRNMVAAFLAVLAPSVWYRWKWWAGLAVVAVLMLGSRGATLALGVACLVMAWDHLGHARLVVLLAPIIVMVLVVIRLATVEARVLCMIEVIRQWAQSGLVFGLGPDFQMALSWGERADNAHSVLPTLLAQTGLVGGLIMALALVPVWWHGWNCDRAELATLLAFATLAIFENVTAWWPVGIVAAMMSASLQNYIFWDPGVD